MDFENVPAYWFVVATLLPLASFLLIFLASGLWCVARRYRDAPGMEQLYQITGGDKPGPTGAYVALGAIALAFVCSLIGAVTYARDYREKLTMPTAEVNEELHALEEQYKEEEDKAKKKNLHSAIEAKEKEIDEIRTAWDTHAAKAWKGRLMEVVHVRTFETKDPERGASLEV